VVILVSGTSFIVVRQMRRNKTLGSTVSFFRRPFCSNRVVFLESIFVVPERFRNKKRKAARKLTEKCSQLSRIELDISEEPVVSF